MPQGLCLDGGCLYQVAITPNGTTAYVAGGDYVYPVTLASETVGPGIFLGAQGWSVAISPDGSYVLVGRSDACGCYSDDVFAIQVSTNSLVDTFSSGGYEHFSISFMPGPPEYSTLSITSPPSTTVYLPGSAVAVPYSTALGAIGGHPPYKWKLVHGLGKLPKGLHLNKSTGAIYGTPSSGDAPGNYAFTVEITDTKVKVKGHPATQNLAEIPMSITIS